MIAARVMVVEDERVVALHLKQQLTRLGYSVPAMATSGAKALQTIQEFRPDVVLMDIHIDGDIDGIETAAAFPPDCRVPVVYLTAYSEEPTLERARQTKPYGYLLKPFSERELHATLQMVLERCRADVLARENEQRLAKLVAERTAELEEQTALRLNAEYERHEMQKLETLGRLTGGVAHDFNNFLSVIIGSLDKIRRRDDLARDEVQRTANVALRSATRAATLIGRLLAFSRRQPLDPTPVHLNDVIGGLVDLLSRTVGESISLDTMFAGDLWCTCVDLNQLESALLNVVVNARDAMPSGGRLRIETKNTEIDRGYFGVNVDVHPGSYVQIAISDDGVGMSKEVLQKACEPFFTTKPGGQGTGLGLSQVYGFFKQSGGHVKIYSELAGGTVVKLYLPKLEASERIVAAEAVAPAAGPQSRLGELILVVEDDKDVRTNTVDNLRELGYEVVEACDGETALQELTANTRITLLFTDVGLPGMNGRQLAEEAKRLRPDLRVLYTSGYAHQALVRDGRLRAGTELLQKPFTVSELGARIRRALD